MIAILDLFRRRLIPRMQRSHKKCIRHIATQVVGLQMIAPFRALGKGVRSASSYQRPLHRLYMIYCEFCIVLPSGQRNLTICNLQPSALTITTLLR